MLFRVCCIVFSSSMWCNICVSFTCKLYVVLFSVSFLWYKSLIMLSRCIISALRDVYKRQVCDL